MKDYTNKELLKLKDELNDKAGEYFKLLDEIQSNCEHRQVGEYSPTDRICLNCGRQERTEEGDKEIDFKVLTSEFHKPLTNGEWDEIQDYFLNPIGINNTKW